jgi:hypothetical protein
MPYTPKGIWYPDGTTPYSIETIAGLLASSVDEVVDDYAIKTYKWANSSARDAQTGMGVGDMGVQSDTNTTYKWNGTAWAVFGNSEWKTWSPTLTALSLGTGYTSQYMYRYSGDMVQVKLKIAIGSGGSVGSNPTFTLPVPATAAISPYQTLSGLGTIYIGSSIYPMAVLQASTTTARFYAFAGNSSSYLNVTATTPGVMGSAATGFVIDFSYEPA